MNVDWWVHRTDMSSVTGLGRYAQSLLPVLASELAGRAPGSRQRLLVPPERHDPDWLPAGVDLVRLPRRRGLHAAWFVAGRPRLDALVGSTDLLHLLYGVVPVPSTAPVIVTVHDLFPLDLPEHYPRSERLLQARWLSWAGRRAAHVLADSRHTADRVLHHTGMDASRLTVVPLGGDHVPSVGDDEIRATVERHGLEVGGYLISVGGWGSRKNIGVVFEALRLSPYRMPLVVTGPGRGHGALPDDLHVVDVGMVSDAELAALRGGARALVHPAWAEGFGFPVVEAMAAGIPVVASDRAALPEVVGDAGLLVDPADPDGWAEAISTVVADDLARLELAAAGRARASRFRWADTAAATADVYGQVVGDP